MISLPIESFHANGKLLLSGEYFVLDGAHSLALPVNKGQSLKVFTEKEEIRWRSYDHEGTCWFEARFAFPDLRLLDASDEKVASTLFEILTIAHQKNGILNKPLSIETHLEFPKEWGFGSSSTLIYNLSQWFNIDPYQLLWNTMGGSGYDIACASANGPIVYQKINSEVKVEKSDFDPTFKDQLYFVYSGKKQNSRDGIKRYRAQVNDKKLIEDVSDLTMSMIESRDLKSFEKVVEEHESLVSKALHLEKVKDLYFKDFWGSIKSLGAWGGDFVLACSDAKEEQTKAYFKQKGCNIFFPYKDLIL